MAGRGPLRKILGGSDVQTPQQVVDKVNELDAKVDKIDKYISQTVEPTLNVHDDNIAGLRVRSDSNDKSTQSANTKVDAVTGSIDDKVNATVQSYLNQQFKTAADAWFQQFDASAKIDAWLNSKDMKPTVSRATALPDGLVPEDLGELMGVLDRVGKRISEVPELQLVAEPVKINSPSGSGGVGVTTTGIPTSLHTITAVQTIEDRLTKLTSTWYPMIVSLQAGWGDMFLPAASSVKAWGQRWSDTSDFVLGNKSRFNDLLSGSSSIFDGRIGTIVDNKIAAFKAQINVTGALNADALGFLGTMTLGQSSLGGAKPKDKILGTIQFHYNNFGSGSLKDSISGSVMDLADEWQATPKGVGYLRGHVQDFWGSGDVTGGLLGSSLKDRIDDWWGQQGLVDKFHDRVNAQLQGLPAYQKLMTYQDKLQSIMPQGDALGLVRDRMRDMRDCIGKVQTNIMANHDILGARISELKDHKTKWDVNWSSVGWAALFGVAGLAFSGKDTFNQFWDHQNEMYNKLIAIVEKQNDMIKNLRDDLDCLKNQFDSTANLIDGKLK